MLGMLRHMVGQPAWHMDLRLRRAFCLYVLRGRDCYDQAEQPRSQADRAGFVRRVSVQARPG